MGRTTPAQRRAQLGFGCVGLTQFASANTAIALLETALEFGLRYFDTAPIYGRGYSERLVGAVLKRRGSEVAVATKTGLWPSKPASGPIGVALAANALKRATRLVLGRKPPAQATDRPTDLDFATRAIPLDALRASFDASRRALGRDRIDVYLLHEATPAALDAHGLEFLLSLRASGAVGALGLAADGRLYDTLDAESLAPWDVLQYQAGVPWARSDKIVERFAAQRHIVHSALKLALSDRVVLGSEAGAILAEQAQRIPNGVVLFSTTKRSNLVANVEGFQKAEF